MASTELAFTHGYERGVKQGMVDRRLWVSDKIKKEERMNLEVGFHQKMLEIYDAAAEFDYYATRFRQMVVSQGGLVAATQLLIGNGLSTGFVQLWEDGRLDLSVEALVLQEPWRELFTQWQLDEAQRRLGKMNEKGWRRANSEWQAWFVRLQRAQERREEFNEPPPSEGGA